MSTPIKKLRYVQRNVTDPALRVRVARIIDAVSNSSALGVSAPISNRVEKAESALSKLEENSDSYLALMRTLPKKHPFKKLVGELSHMAESLSTKMTEAGDELDKILSVDEEDLPGIKASALGVLSDLIKEESGKLADVQELSSMLATLAGKAHKEEGTSPVEHQLPGKEISEGKESDNGNSEIGDTVAPTTDNNPAGPPSGAAAPAASSPNLSAL